MGKGNRERLVPLTGAAVRAIRDWLGVREATLPKSVVAKDRAAGFLFPSSGKLGQGWMRAVFRLTHYAMHLRRIY